MEEGKTKTQAGHQGSKRWGLGSEDKLPTPHAAYLAPKNRQGDDIPDLTHDQPGLVGAWRCF